MGADQCAPGRKPKKITDGLLALAAGRALTGPLADLWLAREMNRALGGTLLGPWDVSALDDGTIDLLLSLNRDMPGIQAAGQRIEAIKQRIRDRAMRH